MCEKKDEWICSNASTSSDGSRGAIGTNAPLKPTEVTLLIIILYNSEYSIRGLRPIYHPLFCQSSVVKYTSSLLQQWTRNETRRPNNTEIAPLTLLAESAPVHMFKKSIVSMTNVSSE